ncbi:MAG: molybdopterin-synthase adenylyltransferase MoeB [Thermoanaerobaculia bacterium]|nr:molybdopterin-synthase adenylyltransferase MoeB [Thermoanaerobaculia bacterium]
MSDPNFSREELLRYSRHFVMPEVGAEGQKRLKDGKVLCVGAGGLGSPAATYLAAAGVGTIGIVDHDEVDLTNLHRQILHGTSDVGRRKIESARRRLEEVNDQIDIRTHGVRLESSNAMEILGKYDVIIDGSDNFATRYLVSDACVMLGKPDVYGSIFRFDGQATVFSSEDAPCYRCLYPDPPEPGAIPSCEQAGVLGILPGLVGTIQATEAVKILLGVGETLAGRLLVIDALRMDFRSVKLRKNTGCPVCGESPTIRELIDYDLFCGGETMTVENDETELRVTELKKKIDSGDELQLIDVREPMEAQIANIPGSKLIPMGELRDRMEELDQGKELVVFCRTGKRSDMAARFLRDRGFRAKNLIGGIHAWSDEIDPTQPKY